MANNLDWGDFVTDAWADYNAPKKRRKKTAGSFEELGDAIREAFRDVGKELFVKKEQALDEAAQLMVDRLNQAAPKSKDTTQHKLVGSFSRTTKYKGVRYVASDYVNDKGIPVANLLEYGSKGKPFIKETYERNVDEVINIITNKLKE